MQLGLAGKVFVVTAASGGLGFATAQALVDEGAGVLLIARNADRLEAAVSMLGGSQQAMALAGDLTDPEIAQRAVKATVEAFGRIDGALINAGAPPKGSVLEVSDEVWRDGFDSVFLAALRTARAVLGANPAARLGFVLSTSAKSPRAQMAVSNGLRPGLAMMIKQLADEIGPDGGRTFGLMPGSIATPRILAQIETDDDPDAARTAAVSGIPLRRFGDPREFAAVATFLLSDAASYLTGCLIPVDGGTMRAL